MQSVVALLFTTNAHAQYAFKVCVSWLSWVAIRLAATLQKQTDLMKA